MESFLERFRHAPGSAVARDEALLDFIKCEITAGRLKPGDSLPTMQTLAEETGISFHQARCVMERLSREKFVRSRPRIGAVVLPREICVNRGKVVLAIPDVDASSYHATQIADMMRARFTSEGFTFTTVVFSQDSRRVSTFLKTELASAPSLVIVMYSMPHVRECLREAGVRAMFLYGDDPGPDAGPWIRFSAESAIADFVEHCLRYGVKSVAQIRFDGNETPDAADRLEEAGISSRWLTIPRWDVLGRYEGIERSAYDIFLDLPRDKFPDVFLFWDDYVAQGALTAFLKRGIAIPEDVKIVTLSNRGLGPVYVAPLTRFECDAASIGVKVADYAISVLERGRVSQPPIVSPQYVFGATFPY